jgi:hypothetical protein
VLLNTLYVLIVFSSNTIMCLLPTQINRYILHSLQFQSILSEAIICSNYTHYAFTAIVINIMYSLPIQVVPTVYLLPYQWILCTRYRFKLYLLCIHCHSNAYYALIAYSIYTYCVFTAISMTIMYSLPFLNIFEHSLPSH